MEALVIGIMMDLVFFARFLYIKKHFYKTKGVANGNGYKYQYASEFIYGYKGHNYVCRVKKNIFSMYHERGSVYTIRVNKDNPYNGVMGNEQTIYMILSIVWFALVGFYIMLLALERLMYVSIESELKL